MVRDLKDKNPSLSSRSSPCSFAASADFKQLQRFYKFAVGSAAMDSCVVGPDYNGSRTGSCSSGLEKELDDLGIMSDEDELFGFVDDYRMLLYRFGWRCNSNDASQPQMHRIWVAKSDCKKSDFVQLLKKIGCEKCFVAPSVESSDAFFAKLTEDEAAKLQGVEGILEVSSCSWIIVFH